MISNTICSTGKMAYKMESADSHILVSVKGEEVYQLVDKSDGTVSLAVFESKFAANRFMGQNSTYFYSKIN